MNISYDLRHIYMLLLIYACYTIGEEIKGRVMGRVPKQLEASTARFVAEKNKGLGTKYLKSKPVCVLLPPELDEWVRSLENRSDWIREAITEKYERER